MRKLDTFIGFSLILYVLEQRKAIVVVIFSCFVIFYAIFIAEKELKVYDKSNKLKHPKSFTSIDIGFEMKILID